MALWGERNRACRHAAAVVDQEEDEDDQEQQAGDDLGEQRGTAEHALADVPRVRAQRVQPFFDRLVDFPPFEVERTLDEPAHDLFHAFVDGRLGLVELIDEQRRNSQITPARASTLTSITRKVAIALGQPRRRSMSAGGTRKVASTSATSTGTMTEGAGAHQRPRTIASTIQEQVHGHAGAGGQSVSLTSQASPSGRTAKPRGTSAAMPDWPRPVLFPTVAEGTETKRIAARHRGCPGARARALGERAAAGAVQADARRVPGPLDLGSDRAAAGRRASGR